MSERPGDGKPPTRTAREQRSGTLPEASATTISVALQKLPGRGKFGQIGLIREGRVRVMTAFRFIAWVLVAVAVALLGADAVSSLEQGVPVIRTTGTILKLFGIEGQGIADVAPGGIAQAIITLLGVPLWAVIGLIGVVLTLVFRPMD